MTHQMKNGLCVNEFRHKNIKTVFFTTHHNNCHVTSDAGTHRSPLWLPVSGFPPRASYLAGATRSNSLPFSKLRRSKGNSWLCWCNCWGRNGRSKLAPSPATAPFVWPSRCRSKGKSLPATSTPTTPRSPKNFGSRPALITKLPCKLPQPWPRSIASWPKGAPMSLTLPSSMRTRKTTSTISIAAVNSGGPAG